MTYRYSALASAAARMWRGWSVLVPVIVANAFVQAALVVPAVPIGGWAWWVLAVVGAVTLAVGFGLVASVALGVGAGRVRWPAALGTLRRGGRRYALWSLAWAVAVAAGWTLWIVPGIVVVAVTPYLFLAALDGARNPLAVDLQVIGRRPWRWLLTVVIALVIAMVGVLVGGLTMFFLRGALGAVICWVLGGLLVAWFTVAWALIYRSASADRR